jgi:transposase
MKKQFRIEFKRDAVQLVLSGQRSQAEVCKNLGISSSTLSKWVRQFRDQEAEERGELDLVKRNRELEAEVRLLKQERDILKKATLFFAKEQT